MSYPSACIVITRLLPGKKVMVREKLPQKRENTALLALRMRREPRARDAGSLLSWAKQGDGFSPGAARRNTGLLTP